MAFPPDVKRLTRERVAEFDAAMTSRFAQGLDQIALDFELAVSDWSDWAARCKVPVQILHGTEDQAVPLAAVREFVADFPEQITMTPVEEAGFLLMYSHADFVISQLRKNTNDLVRSRTIH